MNHRRDVVLWAGAQPTEMERAAMHGAFLTVLPIADDTDFARTRGLVISAAEDSVHVAQQAMGVVDQALDHGCLVYMSYDSDGAFAAIEPHLTTRDHPTVRRLTHDGDASRTLAYAMNRHDPGPSASQMLEIDAGDEALDAEVELLLRRAFADCKFIRLSPLAGGRSSARTYVVEAHSYMSRAGPLLRPFFLKVDERHKIDGEIYNYREFAASHIPWHLTPSVDQSRCLVGHSKALLVGAFVDGSLPLLDAVQRDGDPRPLDQLFNVTLAAWQQEARRKPRTTGPPAVLMGDVFVPGQAKHEVLQCVEDDDDYLAPGDLLAQLRRLPPMACLVGTVHGDLHARNVHVRNADAIVIDLAKVRDGPLSIDLAQMETSLVCEATVPHDDCCRLIAQIYSLGSLQRVPQPRAYAPDVQWLDNCVLRLRELSTEICESEVEYAVAVALHLAARARHEYISEGAEGVERRAVAYLAACRISRGLADQMEHHL